LKRTVLGRPHVRVETAGRLRGRIEAVLDFAKVRGYRNGENPARWKGHLSEALPALRKVRKVKHHAALPYAEIGAFMADLRQRQGGAAAALEFAILTAARTAEAIGAHWSEINMAEGIWTIPAERMKTDVVRRVPLSHQAMAVLRRIEAEKVNDVVFSGQKPGRALSNMALLMMLRRMNRDEITAHGFRSSFRDWAAERTAFPREVVEMALAHKVANKVEAAYLRSELFEKRRLLMEQWSDFCNQPAAGGAAVASLRQGTQRLSDRRPQMR
jgi:integrase